MLYLCIKTVDMWDTSKKKHTGELTFLEGKVYDFRDQENGLVARNEQNEWHSWSNGREFKSHFIRTDSKRFKKISTPKVVVNFGQYL